MSNLLCSHSEVVMFFKSKPFVIVLGSVALLGLGCRNPAPRLYMEPWRWQQLAKNGCALQPATQLDCDALAHDQLNDFKNSEVEAFAEDRACNGIVLKIAGKNDELPPSYSYSWHQDLDWSYEGGKGGITWTLLRSTPGTVLPLFGDDGATAKQSIESACKIIHATGGTVLP